LGTAADKCLVREAEGDSGHATPGPAGPRAGFAETLSPSCHSFGCPDELFGALDAKVRKELRQWPRRLHDELNVTSVFVTHDQEEAFEVDLSAARVAELNLREAPEVDAGLVAEPWQ
jgi:ABC-type taurine transport system ATPase subunit